MIRSSLTLLVTLTMAWVWISTNVSAGRADEPVKLTVAEAAPPDELAGAIRSVLQPTVIRLAEKGKPFFELWLRKELRLAQMPPTDAFALTAVKEGTVLGALKVHQQRRDFRDEEIPPGVYVLRLGLLPEDGDHLGTSPTRTFALLTPARKDRKLAALDYEELVEASSTVNAAEHPSNLNLQPAAKEGNGFPKLASHSDGEHKVVYLRLPARVEGQKKPVAITFAMVYEGIGEI